MFHIINNLTYEKFPWLFRTSKYLMVGRVSYTWTTLYINRRVKGWSGTYRMRESRCVRNSLCKGILHIHATANWIVRSQRNEYSRWKVLLCIFDNDKFITVMRNLLWDKENSDYDDKMKKQIAWKNAMIYRKYRHYLEERGSTNGKRRKKNNKIDKSVIK